MLATAHGASMTHFFVYLIEMDLKGLGELEDLFFNDTVPTIFLERPIRLGIILNRFTGIKRMRIKFGRKKYELDENTNRKYLMYRWRSFETA